ncbi:Translin [Thermogladius calderae 1633]|uniref:Translin n=1 Tax=Thermogladius calderae (strain DSM 22663 / VKM B-2946 / 1633) TaxID=1184251 RepID=I3TCN1_THEC1|nr:Translin [Thermogladius calderae 1633]
MVGGSSPPGGIFNPPVLPSTRWSTIGLEQEVNEAIEYLSVKDKVREQVLKASREILRYSTEATRLIHAGDLPRALENIRRAGDVYISLGSVLAEHPDILYSGILQGALVEYVEAYMTYYAITEGRVPSRAEIGVDHVSYLLGLADFIGELKRHALDLLLIGKLEEAERVLRLMKYVYDNLRKVSFPDALLPGFRHKIDTARRLIETTQELLIYSKNARLAAGALSK